MTVPRHNFQSGLASIRESVQNGQFLSSLAQNASHLLVASHADKRVERLLVRIIITSLASDQAPTLQPVEPPHDRSTGHAHIGSNLCDRKRLPLDIAKRHTKTDEESFQTRTKRFGSRSVSAVHGSHDIDR